LPGQSTAGTNGTAVGAPGSLPTGNRAIGRTRRVPGNLESLIVKLPSRLIACPWRSCPPKVDWRFSRFRVTARGIAGRMRRLRNG